MSETGSILPARTIRVAVGVGSIAGFLLVMSMLLGALRGQADYLVLPVVAIAGVLLLLAALALVAVAFRSIDLHDRTQALGLPEGSIRAIIALALVVLFAILAVYLYSSAGQSTTWQIKDLTEEQAAATERNLWPQGRVTVRIEQPPKAQPAAAQPSPAQGAPPPPATAPEQPAAKLFTVQVREANTVRDDLAKQLLVLIGTLVTAVSSFYFGAKAGGGTVIDVAAQRPPTPRALRPAAATIGAGPRDYVIEGDNLLSVVLVRARRGDVDLPASRVSSSASQVNFQMEFVVGMAEGDWDVFVTDSIGREAKLPVPLKVKQPAPVLRGPLAPAQGAAGTAGLGIAVRGDDLDTVRGFALVRAGEAPIPARVASRAANAITLSVDLPASAPKGKWTLSATDAGGMAVSTPAPLADAFEIT